MWKIGGIPLYCSSCLYQTPWGHWMSLSWPWWWYVISNVVSNVTSNVLSWHHGSVQLSVFLLLLPSCWLSFYWPLCVCLCSPLICPSVFTLYFSCQKACKLKKWFGWLLSLQVSSVLLFLPVVKSTWHLLWEDTLSHVRPLLLVRFPKFK